MLSRARRWFREFFRGRDVRYGVRCLSGKYEKLDFLTEEEAVEWAVANIPSRQLRTRRGTWSGPDFVTFWYQPLELVIDRNKVRRDEHPTP